MASSLQTGTNHQRVPETLFILASYSHVFPIKPPFARVSQLNHHQVSPWYSQLDHQDIPWNPNKSNEILIKSPGFPSFSQHFSTIPRWPLPATPPAASTTSTASGWPTPRARTSCWAADGRRRWRSKRAWRSGGRCHHWKRCTMGFLLPSMVGEWNPRGLMVQKILMFPRSSYDRC